MPLYYFHRRDTPPCPADQRRELHDIGEALAAANQMARTILAQTTDPAHLSRAALDIEDERRALVARVMFADVMRQTGC
ncbi:hypothetical protein OK349_06065 [Sphingomonas sp. BT-65]|uniref:DUF6894 family protein n=1 Tax=Sphingomonas sp. BT-65 TaxID=2989821 RepID=UPI00223576D9|nr:hypothetical protein [Sphingomonas sp. BT-65]MCW4461264.1 hypothetical protein [Sphingomonas sp. BT-65]